MAKHWEIQREGENCEALQSVGPGHSDSQVKLEMGKEEQLGAVAIKPVGRVLHSISGSVSMLMS